MPGYTDNSSRRLYAREIRDYDFEHDESEARLLEMLVDSGAVDQAVSIQFWRDAELYGIREAYIYLKGYAEQGLWKGDLSKVRDQVNNILRRHGRTNFVDNPYGNGRSDVPPGWRKTTLGDLLPDIALASIKKVMNELREARDSGRLHEINVHKRILEALQPYEAMLREKGMDVRFLAYWLENALHQGHFGNNPNRFKTNPYIVAGPELRFMDKMPEADRMIDVKTVGAALPAAPEPTTEGARPAAAEARIIEKVSPGGEAGSGLKHRISEEERARRSRFAKRQKRTREGKFRKNPYDQWVDGAEQNPYFITTSTGMVLTGEPHETESDARLEAYRYMEREIERTPRHLRWREPFTPQVRYTDHPNVERFDQISDIGEVSKFWTNPTGFIKVYSDNSRSLSYSVFFKYDPVRETATVRAIRRVNNHREGVECEIKASIPEARQMLGFIRKRGVVSFLKKIGKSPRVVGHRLFKHTTS